MYLLSQCLTCLRCGGPIVGGTEKGDRRYSCSGRRKGTCAHASVSALKLEKLAVALLRAFLAKMDIGQVVDAYRKSLEPRLEQATAREAGLRKRLTECRKKLKNLLSALEQGILFDDMQVRIRDLKAQEGELADEIGRCQAEASRSVGLDVAVTREYLEGLRRDIESADLARLAVLIPHALKLELDLVEKRGLYYVGIPTEKARPAELALPRAAGGKTPVRMVVGVPGRAYGRGSAFIPLGPFAWKS